MLGLDVTVAVALLLSVASAVVCAVYGLVRWNDDDDRGDEPPFPSLLPGDGDRAGKGIDAP